MTLSLRLFRLWLILAGLWVAYIVSQALFLMWPTEREAIIKPDIITAMQWAVHWALIPPVGLLLSGWLIFLVGRRLRSL
jgi:hypothetical protein